MIGEWNAHPGAKRIVADEVAPIAPFQAVYRDTIYSVCHAQSCAAATISAAGSDDQRIALTLFLAPDADDEDGMGLIHTLLPEHARELAGGLVRLADLVEKAADEAAAALIAKARAA